MKFRQGSANTFCCLTECELMEKYRQDVANENKRVLQQIPTEIDLMSHCFTPREEQVERTRELIRTTLIAEETAVSELLKDISSSSSSAL